uniref:Uncharacterized protein n=1 Tax=Ananas comosus var. bracteatus TaxID=296719 RepID=A0A6V7NN63_ANACO|nr:unnamed protein product [Ananas comosus var. bracteatus]
MFPGFSSSCQASPNASRRRQLSEAGPSSVRPPSTAVFLPPRPPIAGQPLLEACVARVDVPVPHPWTSMTSWLAGSLPEVGEGARGYLSCKAWIRLCDWPILCWNKEDVKAAVSGFGELWEVDEASELCENVSFFRVKVRCQCVDIIPESLELMVEDRRFTVPIEIESSEECNPIFLGESLDQRLGLDSLDAQERFIRLTGFASIPAYGDRSSGGRRQTNLGFRRAATDVVHHRRFWRPAGKKAFSNSNGADGRHVIDRESSTFVSGKRPVSAEEAPRDKPSVLVPSLHAGPLTVPAGPQYLPSVDSPPAGPASDSAGPLLQPFSFGDCVASPASTAQRPGPLLQHSPARDLAAGPDGLLAGPSGPPPDSVGASKPDTGSNLGLFPNPAGLLPSVPTILFSHLPT